MSEQLAAETKVDELAKNVENYLETPTNQGAWFSSWSKSKQLLVQ